MYVCMRIRYALLVSQIKLTYLTYLYLTLGSIAINSYGTLLLLPDLLHVVYRHFRNLSL